MPDEQQTQNTQNSSTIVQPTVPAADVPSSTPISDDMKISSVSVMNEVRARIAEANNILIALSSDPSVDDLAAAIGFSLYLDRIGKRATAIYSGTTPNALEFLKPEETFESTADTLKDFVIALNKDKADHLRYKLDGDYVKIFITPYKKLISEPDLDFSYGDYNVDLVLAIDVSNGVDLDSALREYGRIMHDAAVINITTGNPGRFGEIEWSDKSASSVSEMISKLLYSDENAAPLEKEEATAILTGIVAATNRFSKANTTPETMQIASKLMESGADQQLIAKNITSDVVDELPTVAEPKEEGIEAPVEEVVTENNPNELSIEHEEESPAGSPTEAPTEVPTAALTEAQAEAKTAPAEASADSLLDDLKAAEASLANVATEATPVAEDGPVKIESPEQPLATEPAQMVDPSLTQPEGFDSNMGEQLVSNQDEKVIAPSDDFLSDMASEGTNKYGEMLEAALEESAPAPAPAPMEATVPAPIAEPATMEATMPAPASNPTMPAESAMQAPTDANPALSAVPNVPAAPEINGVPEMNFNAPIDELLPPPPTPQVDMNNPLPTPDFGAMPAPAPMDAAMPAEPAMPSMPTEPAMPTPVTEPTPMAEPTAPVPAAPVNPAPQTGASSAFQIPGM